MKILSNGTKNRLACLRIGNFCIPCCEVVGVFDMDAITTSKVTVDTLNQAQRDGSLRDYSHGELPRSVVATAEGGYCLAAPNVRTLLRKTTQNTGHRRED
ncbi:MAG: hypothetical protein FWG82_00330 [Oscillospiraceae bacterium]|nr:hypothetical protein [Oscillospiraceae bacterium]